MIDNLVLSGGQEEVDFRDPRQVFLYRFLKATRETKDEDLEAEEIRRRAQPKTLQDYMELLHRKLVQVRARRVEAWRRALTTRGDSMGHAMAIRSSIFHV